MNYKNLGISLLFVVGILSGRQAMGMMDYFFSFLKKSLSFETSLEERKAQLLKCLQGVSFEIPVHWKDQGKVLSSLGACFNGLKPNEKYKLLKVASSDGITALHVAAFIVYDSHGLNDVQEICGRQSINMIDKLLEGLNAEQQYELVFTSASFSDDEGPALHKLVRNGTFLVIQRVFRILEFGTQEQKWREAQDLLGLLNKEDCRGATVLYYARLRIPRYVNEVAEHVYYFKNSVEDVVARHVGSLKQPVFKNLKDGQKVDTLFEFVQ